MRRDPLTFVRLLLVTGLLLTPGPAHALTSRQVLVVVNESSPLSERIGEHYRQARNISKQHVVRIRTSPLEEIDRATYKRDLEQPIAMFLSNHRLQDQVLAIVLTKGVPLKIRGTGGATASQSSVDSELALLYRAMLYGHLPPEGRIANPYFSAGAPVPFSRQDHDVYLVTRLDGYSWIDVRNLIDRGLQPAKQGKIVLDMKLGASSGSAIGNTWLKSAADRLKDSGLHVVLNESTAPVLGQTEVLGYAGWGSNDWTFKRRTPGFRWLPGALASWYVSTSARTFTPPPADWNIGAWDEPATFHVGSPQSLIADLIAEGATGAAGSAYEPYLDGTARPDILFPAYRAGLTLAEAFYRALPFLSWQSVIIGDPLVAPFAPPATRGEPTAGIALFLQRRAHALETALQQGASPELTRALALVHTEQAKDAAREQRLDDALALVRRALALRSDEPVILFAAAVIHALRKERTEAEDALRAVIRVDPGSKYAAEAERLLGH